MAATTRGKGVWSVAPTPSPLTRSTVTASARAAEGGPRPTRPPASRRRREVRASPANCSFHSVCVALKGQRCRRADRAPGRCRAGGGSLGGKDPAGRLLQNVPYQNPGEAAGASPLVVCHSRRRLRFRRRLPDLHGPVQAGRGDPLAVGAERYPLDPPVVAAARGSPCRPVPDLDGAVAAAPGQSPRSRPNARTAPHRWGRAGCAGASRSGRPRPTIRSAPPEASSPVPAEHFKPCPRARARGHAAPRRSSSPRPDRMSPLHEARYRPSGDGTPPPRSASHGVQRPAGLPCPSSLPDPHHAAEPAEARCHCRG
jgi:hypothetical protein